MGKVIERVKLSSLFDPAKSVQVDALIDAGASTVALPQSLVRELALRKIDEVTVRYADNHRQRKSVYAGLLIEIKGRVGNFTTLAEDEGTEPLIGQIVLEQLDLIVDPGSRRLAPNPRSPDMPMIDQL